MKLEKKSKKELLKLIQDQNEKIDELETYIEHQEFPSVIHPKSIDILEDFLDIPHVMYVSVGTTGRIIDMNQQGAKLLGYERSEVINKNWFDTFIPERNREDKVKMLKQFEDGVFERTNIFENVIVSKSKKELSFIWYVKSIKDHDGRVMGLYGAGIDITQRKKYESELIQSNKRFEILSDKSTLGVIILENDIVSYVNKRVSKLLGIKKKELIDKEFTNIFTFPGSEVFVTRLKKIKEMKTQSSNLFLSIRNKRDIFKDLDIHVVKVNHAPNSNMILLFINDITRLNSDILASNQAAKYNALGILGKGIGHDLNNLHTVIHSSIELLSNYLREDQKAARLMERIRNAILLSHDVIEKISDISASQIDTKIHADITDMIEKSTIEILKEIGIEYSVTIQKALPLLYCVPHRIITLLKNVFENAIEAIGHGKQGKIDVFVGSKKISSGNPYKLAPGNYLTIEIVDDGKGILKDNIDKVFDPYYSTKDMPTEKSQGLGLAIAYAIVQEHKGRIAVESNLETGTKFSILLPFK